MTDYDPDKRARWARISLSAASILFLLAQFVPLGRGPHDYFWLAMLMLWERPPAFFVMVGLCLLVLLLPLYARWLARSRLMLWGARIFFGGMVTFLGAPLAMGALTSTRSGSATEHLIASLIVLVPLLDFIGLCLLPYDEYGEMDEVNETKAPPGPVEY